VGRKRQEGIVKSLSRQAWGFAPTLQHPEIRQLVGWGEGKLLKIME
jgi:hypothetical protein